MDIPIIGQGPQIIGGDEARIKKCTKKIKDDLQYFNCVLLPRLVILGGNIELHDIIIATKKEPPAEKE